MKNIGKMLIQAQQMKRQMDKVQKELKRCRFEASSGDLVTVEVNGAMETLSVRISEEAFDSGDRKKLEKALVSAVNEAHEKAKEASQEKLGPLVSDMGIPGM